MLTLNVWTQEAPVNAFHGALLSKVRKHKNSAQVRADEQSRVHAHAQHAHRAHTQHPPCRRTCTSRAHTAPTMSQAILDSKTGYVEVTRGSVNMQVTVVHTHAHAHTQHAHAHTHDHTRARSTCRPPGCLPTAKKRLAASTRLPPSQPTTTSNSSGQRCAI